MATCSDGKASESCNCAGLLLSNLPDDVLVEILCRVTDRKHLTRLKSVCKSWSNLITDACAPKISASSPPQGLIYIVKKARNGKPHNIDYFPCPMTPGVASGPHKFVKSYSSLLPFQPTRNDFLDCCNCLLLFVEGCALQYYVCNPMTKHCVAIPKGSTFYIWFLEDRGKNDRWTLIHRISVDYLGKHQHQLDRITISRFGKISSLRPFALHPTSDVIFFGIPRVMLSYHLQDWRFKLIYRAREDRQILLGQLLVFPYTPCLVNPKHFG